MEFVKLAFSCQFVYYVYFGKLDMHTLSSGNLGKQSRGCICGWIMMKHKFLTNIKEKFFLCLEFLNSFLVVLDFANRKKNVNQTLSNFLRFCYAITRINCFMEIINFNFG